MGRLLSQVQGETLSSNLPRQENRSDKPEEAVLEAGDQEEEGQTRKVPTNTQVRVIQDRLPKTPPVTPSGRRRGQDDHFPR